MNTEVKKFNHLWTEIDAAYHEVALKLGLSDSTMMILYTICNSGEECMLSDITHLSGISKQTVNSALRKLESADMICLELVGMRKKKVRLTERGKKLANETALKVIEIENKIYSSWTKDEWTLYLELTQRFLHDFKEHTKELSRRTI